MKVGRKPIAGRYEMAAKFEVTDSNKGRALPVRLIEQLESCADDSARHLLLGKGEGSVKRTNGRRRAASFHGNMHRLHCWISPESKERLEDMSGQESLGWFVEELIQREYRRRVKRMEQATAEHKAQQVDSA